MMIKIDLLNTLSEDQKKHKKNRNKFWLILLVAIVVELGIILNLSVFEKARIKYLENKQTYLNSFYIQTKVIQKKESEEKILIKTISGLEKGKNLPVKILYLAANTTPNKVWITRLEKQNNVLIISADSLDVDSISLFMNNLSKESIIKDVQFVQGVTKLADKKQDIYQFSLKCELR